MTTTVLAYLPSPAQGVWHIGPVPIRAYALCIIVGIVAALIIGDRRWEARGGERGVIYDIALWAVPFGLVGGRLYHVLTDWPTYFGPEGRGLLAAFQVWEGGLGIWGAVALGGVGAWIACRRYGIPLPAFGDAIAPGIILAQAIGRLGNYFNQELYGRDTTMPWGLEIYQRLNAYGRPDDLNGVSTGVVEKVVHPTFLYELLWNLLVFVLLIWVDRKFKMGHGRLFALYVAGYCLGRFGVELMRDDFATHIAGIRINTFTSAFILIGAAVYMMLAPKGREDPATLRRSTDEDSGSAAVSAPDDADHMHPDEVSSEDDGAEAAAAIEMKGIVGEPEDVPDGEEAVEGTSDEAGVANTAQESDETVPDAVDEPEAEAANESSEGLTGEGEPTGTAGDAEAERGEAEPAENTADSDDEASDADNADEPEDSADDTEPASAGESIETADEPEPEHTDEVEAEHDDTEPATSAITTAESAASSGRVRRWLRRRRS